MGGRSTAEPHQLAKPSLPGLNSVLPDNRVPLLSHRVVWVGFFPTLATWGLRLGKPGGFSVPPQFRDANLISAFNSCRTAQGLYQTDGEPVLKRHPRDAVRTSPAGDEEPGGRTLSTQLISNRKDSTCPSSLDQGHAHKYVEEASHFSHRVLFFPQQ